MFSLRHHCICKNWNVTFFSLWLAVIDEFSYFKNSGFCWSQNIHSHTGIIVQCNFGITPFSHLSIAMLQILVTILFRRVNIRLKYKPHCEIYCIFSRNKYFLTCLRSKFDNSSNNLCRILFPCNWHSVRYVWMRF